jgi:hydroxyacylglutathione hydrolase
MKRLADDVYMLSGFPPNFINVYLLGDVLIDAATRQGERRILRQIEGHKLTAHALTHAHADHQGSSHAICERLQIPLWCGREDIPAMESGVKLPLTAPWAIRAFEERFWAGPPHPVARPLQEGDEVAGFQVLETPGHSPGHVAFWRERDRVLILGDVLNNMNVRTGIPGLHEPPAFFTPDPVRNRESARRLAALEPALVCFGHGAPLRDTAKLRAFVAGLG